MTCELHKRIKEKVYIGDGLYAQFDGWHIVLSAPRMNGEHFVCLEPSVLREFDEYRERLYKNLKMHEAL
jgi:tartrate dehydratase beta subunit/fumarate hydratase class I family protein